MYKELIINRKNTQPKISKNFQKKRQMPPVPEKIILLHWQKNSNEHHLLLTQQADTSSLMSDSTGGRWVFLRAARAHVELPLWQCLPESVARLIFHLPVPQEWDTYEQTLCLCSGTCCNSQHEVESLWKDMWPIAKSEPYTELWHLQKSKTAV